MGKSNDLDGHMTAGLRNPPTEMSSEMASHCAAELGDLRDHCDHCCGEG